MKADSLPFRGGRVIIAHYVVGKAQAKPECRLNRALNGNLGGKWLLKKR